MSSEKPRSGIININIDPSKREDPSRQIADLSPPITRDTAAFGKGQGNMPAVSTPQKRSYPENQGKNQNQNQDMNPPVKIFQS